MYTATTRVSGSEEVGAKNSSRSSKRNCIRLGVFPFPYYFIRFPIRMMNWGLSELVSRCHFSKSSSESLKVSSEGDPILRTRKRYVQWKANAKTFASPYKVKNWTFSVLFVKCEDESCRGKGNGLKRRVWRRFFRLLLLVCSRSKFLLFCALDAWNISMCNEIRAFSLPSISAVPSWNFSRNSFA